MAKSTNGLGQFSGKVGSVVFAVQNGQQVARQYQPIVGNPRSDGQLQQRAKFSFAGKLTSVFPSALLRTLGTNNRLRRGAMVSQIVNNSDVVKSGDGYSASLDASKLRIVKGFDYPGLIRTDTPPSYTQQGLTVQWNDLDGRDGFTSNDQVMVLAVIVNRSAEYSPALLVAEDIMQMRRVDIDVTPYLDKDYVAHCYIVGSRATTAGVNGVSGDGVGGTNEAYSSLLDLAFGGSSIDLMNSYYLGSVDLVTP